MSHTVAVGLSRGKSVIAIAGATGRLGQHVTPIFLSSPFRHYFSKVIILTRDPTSQAAKDLEGQGGVPVKFGEEDGDDALKKALAGVDVVINLLGSKAGDMKERLLTAVCENDVRVYVPSEFGVDHRTNDFDDWDNKEWIKKREHIARAKKLLDSTCKVVSVYVGLFLEDSIGPWFGFDVSNHVFEAINSASVPIAFTSKADIGRVLAQLAILSMSPLSDTVPEYIRVVGSAVSYDSIRKALEDATGSTISTTVLNNDREEIREGYLNGSIKDPARHIRILMGEGKLDFCVDNQNELVNPGESVWKWKTVKEYIAETYGKTL